MYCDFFLLGVFFGIIIARPNLGALLYLYTKDILKFAGSCSIPTLIYLFRTTASFSVGYLLPSLHDSSLRIFIYLFGTAAYKNWTKCANSIQQFIDASFDNVILKRSKMKKYTDRDGMMRPKSFPWMEIPLFFAILNKQYLCWKFMKGFNCSICFNENPSVFEVVKLSECNHHFCSSCIGKWSKMGYNNGQDYCCPQCRKRSRSIKYLHVRLLLTSFILIVLIAVIIEHFLGLFFVH